MVFLDSNRKDHCHVTALVQSTAVLRLFVCFLVKKLGPGKCWESASCVSTTWQVSEQEYNAAGLVYTKNGNGLAHATV